MSKLQIYRPSHDPNVKAVQFFHNDLPSSKLIQKVWAHEWKEHFVLKRSDRDAGEKYVERYVIRGCSSYLNDGDWIVISSDGYARVESNGYFQLAFRKV